ncbi:leucyl/phenylalanyl-tRNA--protein transferase [Rhizorhapis sp. SPR117]|uniref:leucyl/phenylalanyl-tRNA--protein transferase n=1 Tax=Rhizorhapis sp. SPR117 TaxID=2912611 RepID=UPI0030C8A041
MMAIDLNILLRAYAMGIFPMADSRDDPEIFWVEPKKRSILPLDELHLSRSLRKTIRSDKFRVTADRDFPAVLQACAEPAPDRPETWINPTIAEACLTLFRMGYAHSVECWMDDTLVGGLYGISLGRAFFGESMFSRKTDASKVALAWLVARLKLGGFELLDCQFMTDHLRSLGAVEISQKHYLSLLDDALAGAGAAMVGGVSGAAAASVLPVAGDFSALDVLAAAPSLPNLTVSGPVSGQLILQLLTQTS